MSRDQRELAPYDHTVRGLLVVLSLFMLLTLMSAVLFYTEPFRFWHHAFSNLGSTQTKSGLLNITARTIFALGMVLEAGVMLCIAAQYARSRSLSLAQLRSGLALLGATGFAISIFPNDLYHTLHSIGVGVVMGALNFFTMKSHFELKERISSM